jgi:hypothetical protein
MKFREKNYTMLGVSSRHTTGNCKPLKAEERTQGKMIIKTMKKSAAPRQNSARPAPPVKIDQIRYSTY